MLMRTNGYSELVLTFFEKWLTVFVRELIVNKISNEESIILAQEGSLTVHRTISEVTFVEDKVLIVKFSTNTINN